MSNGERPSLSGVRALLIDLDGVIYRGEQPLLGANVLLSALDELGMEHVFVTNNSALTPEQVAAKLNQMSVTTTPDHVVTSAIATADYLQTVERPGAHVFVLGEEGLRSALTASGFTVDGAEPTCVVVGLDRTLTYARLAQACLAVRAGARFVATNTDPALPVESGFWPGAGALVAALQTATNVEPFVVGKPAATILQSAMRGIHADPDQTAMVGDQIASDVRAGRAAGTMTILVGHDQPTPDAEPKPDLWVGDLLELIAALQRSR